MTHHPNTPRILKAGLVLLDPASSAITRMIALQYNPDQLSRTLQVQAMGESGSGGDRSQALRMTGPAVETIKLDAEIDASDQLEFPDRNAPTTQAGVLPAIYALEALLYPPSARLQADHALAGSGTLVIAPVEAPLSVLVWGPNRIAPVRVTDFSVTEEAFDTNLNPIRAKVSLGFRVLSVSDLGFEHRGGSLFMAYLRAKEQLAQRAPAATFATLGIGGLP